MAGRRVSTHDGLNSSQASPVRSRAIRILSQLVVGIAALVTWPASLQAGTIGIPNASFESPVTTFATPLTDSWQQIPPPDFLNQIFLSGVFTNTPPPIDNCDGNQAAFLFANPQAALFQDYDSTDYSSPVPTHAFDATYDVGKSYTLTVAVLGGTNVAIPMPEGTTLELSLYYRDSTSNMVTVAATSITNIYALFSNATPHFIDFQVQVPLVKTSDPWAGQHIGVQLLSTVTVAVSGYWDLDNVRLVSTVRTTLLAPARSNGQFSCTLQSEPGLRFEMLASTNVTAPMSNWTSLGTLTNVTGAIPFLDTATNLTRRFYRAQQLP